jgi:hypothetical protein
MSPKLVPELLVYFRPGEQSHMRARCQFLIRRNGTCGVGLTYPIKGLPWRRNPRRDYEFSISPEFASDLFAEVVELKDRFPKDCLSDETLWSDHSERGSNAITRDADSVACHTISTILPDRSYGIYYSMREDSVALRRSKLFTTITELIAPFEHLCGMKTETEARGGAD